MNTSILDRRELKKLAQRKSQVIFIYAFLVILMIVAGSLDSSFLTIENFQNLLITALPYLLVSFAQTFIILTGGIDLSGGAMVSLSSVICATLFADQPELFAVTLAVSLVSGLLLGVVNGILVTKGNVQPIIVTLSTQVIIQGIALMVLDSPGGTVNADFSAAVNGLIGPIPVPLLLGIAATVIIWIVLNRSRFGHSVLAIGGNENAAYSSGIPVTKIKIIVYAIAGVMSALAGIMLAARMYSGDPTVGVNMTNNSITTAVVGGTSLAGGKGGIIGNIAGVFILIIINNILNLVGVSSFYQYVVQGGILILALAISSIRSRRQ